MRKQTRTTPSFSILVQSVGRWKRKCKNSSYKKVVSKKIPQNSVKQIKCKSKHEQGHAEEWTDKPAILQLVHIAIPSLCIWHNHPFSLVDIDSFNEKFTDKMQTIWVTTCSVNNLPENKLTNAYAGSLSLELHLNVDHNDRSYIFVTK